MRRAAWLLVAISLLFGLGYPLLWSQPVPEATLIAAKGMGVALLAVAAASIARGTDGWLLAAVLAFGAAGDVLLEIEFGVGAAAFALGHVVAILLYLRNRRAAGAPGWAAAGLLPVAAAIIPAILLRGRPEAIPFAAYALLLGAMAGSAWLSRFSRLVTMGALLFLVSDMLIALRMASGETWLSLPIWLLYYLGQLMIFLGVTSSLPPRERSSGGGGPPKVVEG
ncbi:MAG TPA: lysoplasmalogenase [Allosphingosinicella sp.]|jgi:uncharacterized membrane protein YhhN